MITSSPVCYAAIVAAKATRKIVDTARRRRKNGSMVVANILHSAYHIRLCLENLSKALSQLACEIDPDIDTIEREQREALVEAVSALTAAIEAPLTGAPQSQADRICRQASSERGINNRTILPSKNLLSRGAPSLPRSR